MRFSQRLYAQHLGWMFKKHWQVQGKRIPRDTGAAAELQKHGIVCKDPLEVLIPKVEHEKYEAVGWKEKEEVFDQTHPLWNDKPCLVYGDRNVLLEGLPQAQVLTKTIVINNFPKYIDELIGKMPLSGNFERNAKNLVATSHALDAEQVKLPKVKLVDRPSVNLPRVYGISHKRTNRLLITKMLNECEKMAGHSVTQNRRILRDSSLKVTIPRNGDLLQFELVADFLVSSSKPLEQVKGQFQDSLPDLYPLKCTITMPKKNIYSTDTIFPLPQNLKSPHPHTIISVFNKHEVGNLHETSVTESQLESRTMLKAFTAAASQAKNLYRDQAFEKLPKPIVVQSIQTDGCKFHFGIFQLNTLSLGETEGIQNYWFHKPSLNLFSFCGFKSGRLALEDLNINVFRHMYAFYNNV